MSRFVQVRIDEEPENFESPYLVGEGQTLVEALENILETGYDEFEIFRDVTRPRIEEAIRRLRGE